LPARINEKLNLVVEIENDNGETLYVHSTPIMKETFKKYYLILTKAFNQFYSNEIGVFGAPRVAAMVIEEKAKVDGIWDDVKNGLINEIHRLTNVVVLTQSGWQIIPLEVALQQKLISEDDFDLIENFLCFFTVVSTLHLQKELRPIMNIVSSMWGPRVEPLNVTEFKNGLQTLTQTENTVESPTLSSIPS
jgi:hypothetical protein